MAKKKVAQSVRCYSYAYLVTGRGVCWQEPKTDRILSRLKSMRGNGTAVSDRISMLFSNIEWKFFLMRAKTTARRVSVGSQQVGLRFTRRSADHTVHIHGREEVGRCTRVVFDHPPGNQWEKRTDTFFAFPLGISHDSQLRTSGSVIPIPAHTSLKKAWGTLRRIPAPSPETPSVEDPRCSIR